LLLHSHASSPRNAGPMSYTRRALWHLKRLERDPSGPRDSQGRYYLYVAPILSMPSAVRNLGREGQRRMFELEPEVCRFTERPCTTRGVSGRVRRMTAQEG
jgi:hypothetical protein